MDEEFRKIFEKFSFTDVAASEETDKKDKVAENAVTKKKAGSDSDFDDEENEQEEKDMNHRYDKTHPDIRPYSMMTRTGYMEYNPMKNRGKLPEIYARVIGQYIGDTVFLQDINENQIQVAVLKKNNSEIYLTHGWSRLRDFYNINAGAWITLLLISPFVFFIRVRYITGMEITYPHKTPPYKLMLEKPFLEATSNGPIPYFVLPKVFSHSLEKTLTIPDVQTGTLTLYWRGFCQNALPNEETQLRLIDWLGNTWNHRDLKFVNSPYISCKISGQWGDVCKVHNLAKDVIVKFGVTEASNNRTIYFKLAPFIGVRTTLHAPSTSSNRKKFYQSQHYYML
ncbi:uncharacterized protein LOC123917148 isoform X1 [Trifolium pratense]|uniref:uncharacterized protein LOC123917148 isoform X1 n=1 Tax=Trifolium pratense TaxID=57577 RepID=UPI001E695E7B|nr:uncharacterized protein LOC123917148 isoform X1 [Trifolium pratense]XP_045824735.1 uncharacterized protein LOC123917148 isoform X1 [Trifolium pratense]XP_045824736.1 uncharacterized protein LOC123917148 isoform X1 [Trifolium pratense]XP_045824737.1 uncharacterized protein LOC123917148 isoform X1 [Trifolium pratense]XP_045824738.1 uncharacterized protein LOC123917148 isoform X1 [Trifolium pratense]XP_045824739.1 uncharacterized protein LOC123917148 isoform X1 [Trifolium pratense]XP_04582474